MRVEEVHFNHDTSAATGDALNIRVNASGGPIIAPEWKRGTPPQPAAYAAAVLGAQVTIKARFSGGPADGSRRIRAIDAWVPPSTPGGFLGWLLGWLSQLLHALFGNVLGNTDTRTVNFDAAGKSGLVTFALVNHKLKTSGVGIRTSDWKWQFHHGGHWHDFDTTQHKIYLVLDMPQGPWNQNPAGNNLQLPWTVALDKACSWALGVTTKDAAAERITIAINTQSNQSYTPATMFLDSSGAYKLTSYLAQLNGGAPFKLNCTDCADAVTTFSNLLGCDLFEGRFFNMQTKPFLTLNGNPATAGDWVTWNWGYHEICWLHQIGQNELVYDGCLQLDMANSPPPHVAQHPVKMPFGMNGPNDYRYRLVQSGPATLANTTSRRLVK